MTALNTDNTQTWSPADNRLWASVPGTVDTTQKAPLGAIGLFKDPYFGVGEFIYLAGVASTAVGDAVTYLGSTYATTRAAAGNGVAGPVAIATAATVASTWGWYQISGLAVANKTKTVSLAAGVGVGISTTALIALSSSLKELQGAKVAIVASATTTTLYGNKVILQLQRPTMQGRIT